MADQPRLFPINSHPEYGFHAGTTADGRQVLMGLLCPNLVAHLFDGDGRFLGIQTRPLDFLTPSAAGIYNIYDKRIPGCIEVWRGELGLTPGVIRVRSFSAESGVAIDEHPDHLDELLDDPDASDDEKEEARESLRRWEEDREFVLYWGNDYWLDDKGEVTSS